MRHPEIRTPPKFSNEFWIVSEPIEFGLLADLLGVTANKGSEVEPKISRHSHCF
jgi:hypothetical protein